jgi:hypothetical protein
VTASGIVEAQGSRLRQREFENNLSVELSLANEKWFKDPATCAEYPLLILSSDEQKQIKPFIADANGHYQLALLLGIAVNCHF